MFYGANVCRNSNDFRICSGYYSVIRICSIKNPIKPEIP